MTKNTTCKRCPKCGRNWVHQHNYCHEKARRKEPTPHQIKLDRRLELQKLMIRQPKDIMIIKIRAEPEKQYDIYKTIKDNEQVKEVFVYC